MFIVLLESKIIYPLALERQQRQRSSNHILWVGLQFSLQPERHALNTCAPLFAQAWRLCSRDLISRRYCVIALYSRAIGFRYSFEIPSYIRKPKIKGTFHMRLKWWLFGYSEDRNRLWIFSIRCLAEETSSTQIHPSTSSWSSKWISLHTLACSLVPR